MAKEIRYKCVECRRILAKRLPHKCKGVYKNQGYWKKIIVVVD